MKIFYTDHFKEDLKNETKKLYLGYYGLRHGSFKKALTSDNLVMGIQSSPISGFYIAQGLEYSDSGFYYTESGVGKESSYYQVIIFYYSDLTSPISDNIQVAFILFSDFDNANLEFKDKS